MGFSIFFKNVKGILRPKVLRIKVVKNPFAQGLLFINGTNTVLSQWPYLHKGGACSTWRMKAGADRDTRRGEGQGRG